MTTILEALQGTPLWVYLVFFYLVWIGFRARKEHSAPIGKLVTVPLFFLLWGLWNLYERNLLLHNFSLLFIVGLFLGSLVSAKLFQPLILSVDRDTKSIRVKGSWQLLISLLIVFAGKYALGVSIGFSPELLKEEGFQILYISAQGLLSGLFIGRLYASINALVKGPHAD